VSSRQFGRRVSQSERIRLALPIIERGAATGASTRSIQTELRRRGLGVRDSVIGNITRQRRGIIIKQENIRFTPLNQAVNPERMRHAITNIPSQYSWTVEIRAVSETGQRIIRHVTVRDDVNHLTSEVLNLAEDALGSRLDSIKITSMVMVDVVRNPR